MLLVGTWWDAFLWLPLIAVPIMVAQLVLGRRVNLERVIAWIELSLAIICVGWTVTVLAMIWISSPASAWAVLIAWGLFRNSPFPVAYALVVDSTPRAASSGMGLVVGIALGVSGIIVPTVSGWIIDHYGFTWDYVMLAAACLLALLPIVAMRETVRQKAAGPAGQPVAG
ncbi:MFS transporter [Actinopolymorpha sp. NPDC004070]|uniref:MFS transporter n=1 Tax=Actinopolymorpha sp. NPDC004070 TaxID=3154548 RepID=UPI0033BAEFD3